jgi:hypothetical protein
MRRPLLLLAAILLVAGCAGTEPVAETAPEAPSRPTEPQRVTLDWRERYPATGEGLTFEVGVLSVHADGWSVTIAVTNRTKIGWTHEAGPSQSGYGVALFATGLLAEVERAASDQTLPAPRQATSIEPPPPATLAPGETWRATLSARGSLADGTYLRVTFGPLYADGDPPNDMQDVVFWITDKAHRL